MDYRVWDCIAGLRLGTKRVSGGFGIAGMMGGTVGTVNPKH